MICVRQTVLLCTTKLQIARKDHMLHRTVTLPRPPAGDAILCILRIIRIILKIEVSSHNSLVVPAALLLKVRHRIEHKRLALRQSHRLGGRRKVRSAGEVVVRCSRACEDALLVAAILRCVFPAIGSYAAPFGRLYPAQYRTAVLEPILALVRRVGPLVDRGHEDAVRVIGWPGFAQVRLQLRHIVAADLVHGDGIRARRVDEFAAFWDGVAVCVAACEARVAEIELEFDE